jgi:hypothetical protein
MIDEQIPPGAGGPSRRRPGPTIEGEATEIASTAVSGDHGETPSSASTGADRTEPPQAEGDAAPGAAAHTDDADSGPQSSAGGSPPRWSRFGPFLHNPAWPLIAAAAAGAAFVLLAVLVLHSLTDRGGDASPVETRLAALEDKVAELAGRPAGGGVDAKTIEALGNRVTAVEMALRTQRPPPVDPALANRMATLEGQLKALDEKIEVVARRTDDIDTIARGAQQRGDRTATSLDDLAKKVATLAAEPGSTGEIDSLSKRVSALEQTVAGLEKRASGDHAARLSAAATALNAAVARGEPFSDELAAMKALGADSTALTVLEPYAASGVPSAASLGRELAALLPALNKAAGTPAGGSSFLDRILSHAGSLVRIRRVDDLSGDDPATVLARLENRAAQSDIDGAIADIAKLPPDIRSQAQVWVAKAEARKRALDASRRLLADAAAALARTP